MRIVLPLLLLFFPHYLLAQAYNYVNYDTKDGLAASTVYDECQDKEGFIWFATENGLSRYDGTQFKNFTVKNGLPDNEVLKLYADSRGRVWISTFSKEICYYYKGRIFDKNNDSIVSKLRLVNLIETIFEDDKGNLIFGDNRKVMEVRTDNQVIELTAMEPFKSSKAQYKGAFPNPLDGGIFFAMEDTVYRYTNGKWLPFNLWSIPRISVNNTAIKFDSSRNLKLIASPDPVIGSTLGSPTSTAYVSTTNGAWTIDTVNLRMDEHLLPGLMISKTMRDDEGNLWFTTLGHGIYKLPSREIRNLNLPAKGFLNNREIFALAKCRDEMVVGMGFSKLVFFNDRKITRIGSYERYLHSSLSTSTNNKVYSLAVHSSGDIYAGFNSFILKLNAGKPICNYTIRNVKSLAVIDKDYILTGSARFAFKVRSSDLAVVDTLWQERCSKVFYSHQKYYIGTLNGLYEINQDKTYKYLGDLQPALTRCITDIKNGADSTLWIATNDHGVVGYRAGRITALITDTNGLSSNICKSLFYSDGFLWVGTNKGLNKINLASTPYHVLRYSTTDGLASDIINAIYVEDSLIYVGTPLGLTYFNENKISSTSACNLRILGVSISNKEQRIDSSYLLSYRDNNIHFDFVAISFKAGGDIVYHYRLRGLDSKWQETRETSLDYQSLPPGDYQLELYAVNKYGVKSETRQIRFSIETPFWQSWWFYTLIILAVIAITWWLVNRRNRKKRITLEEKSRIQQQFAELEQQALQAQMNPHFIFNCLNSIQQYILTNDKEKANGYLTGFASLIRQTLDNSGKKTITVSEEVRYLTTYLEMEKMRFGDNFAYHISVDDSVNADYIDMPAMLLQPYVENCLRHGIRYRQAGLGVVDIRFKTQDNTLTCSVKDNGVGRKRAAELKSKSHIEYQSKGMNLTGKRIELLNKINENSITVEVKDLEDVNGDATGTEVILNIPI